MQSRRVRRAAALFAPRARPARSRRRIRSTDSGRVGAHDRHQGADHFLALAGDLLTDGGQRGAGDSVDRRSRRSRRPRGRRGPRGRGTRPRGSLPSAKASEKQRTAVGRSGRSSRVRAVSSAALDGRNRAPGRRAARCRRPRGRPASRASARGGGSAWVGTPSTASARQGDDPDPAVPEVDEMLSRRPGAAPVVDVDAGDRGGWSRSMATSESTRWSSQARSSDAGLADVEDRAVHRDVAGRHVVGRRAGPHPASAGSAPRPSCGQRRRRPRRRTPSRWRPRTPRRAGR